MSISTTDFNTALANQDNKKIKYILDHYSYKDSHCFYWLALHDFSPQVLNLVQDKVKDIQMIDAGAYFKLSVSHPLISETKMSYLRQLIDHMGIDECLRQDLACFAAANNQSDVLELLNQQHQHEKKRAYPWGEKSQAAPHREPLYFALSSGHLHTVVYLLRQGSSLSSETLSKIFKEQNSWVQHIKQVWHSAVEKSSLEHAVRENVLQEDHHSSQATAEEKAYKKRKL